MIIKEKIDKLKNLIGQQGIVNFIHKFIENIGSKINYQIMVLKKIISTFL